MFSPSQLIAFNDAAATNPKSVGAGSSAIAVTPPIHSTRALSHALPNHLQNQPSTATAGSVSTSSNAAAAALRRRRREATLGAIGAVVATFMLFVALIFVTLSSR